MISDSRVVGAILSGGTSSRMGSAKDRLLLPDGQSMFLHVARTLLEVCPKIVAAGIPLDLPREIAQKTTFVVDNFRGCGPLAGLEAVLSHVVDNMHEVTTVLVTGCDQPGLSTVILVPLLSQSHDAKIIHYTSLTRSYPLPALYPTHILSAVRQQLLLGHSFSLRSLLEKSKTVELLTSDTEESFLAGVNTPEELQVFVQSSKFW